MITTSESREMIGDDKCEVSDDDMEEDIDVGSNTEYDGLEDSDNEADIGSDDNTEVVNKTVGGVRSFGIDDILNHSSKGDRNKNVKKPSQGRSPLDALFTMTTNFDSLKQKQDKIELRKDMIAKKKRKSRTAFTNHQIFELEKR